VQNITQIRRRKLMDAPTEYLYRRYMVTLDIMSPGIAGGVPLDKGLIASHIEKFSQGVTNALQVSKKQEGEVSEEAINKYMLSVSSGFLVDDKGIYIRGMQFNAMIKDAAQRMKATVKTKGLGNTIRDGGLLFPAKVYLGVEPTVTERPVKPDNAPANLKIFQVAENVKISVPCAVLENGDLPDSLFRQIWIVAQGIGLGANRHLGYGRFEVGIEEEGDWNITQLFTNGHKSSETSPVPAEVMG
jgi:hypothetical protein